jgi:CubicO group peptidase (beta-lactamase class C family)
MNSRALGFSSVIPIALFAFLCPACIYARIVYFNVPDLAAPTYFDERVVRQSSEPIALPRAPTPATFSMRRSRSHAYETFEALIAQNDTRALVVVHHDVIVYEAYFGRITAETRLPCFSMSKTFAAALMGRAQMEGLIGSVRQYLIDYVPDLWARPHYWQITLEHLLRMNSGLDFTEESVSGAMLFYATDLNSPRYLYDVKWPPGEHYEYGSINGQMLWRVLHHKLGEETLSHYFQEHFWQPIGAERPAAWALDSSEHGVEKFAAGFSATTRDYARLGLLFQHHGRVGDRQVIPEQWVRDSLEVDEIAGVVHTTDGAVRRGRYQWFWTLDGRSYFAKGYHGQYVFVDRDRDVVIVRFGEGYGDVDWTALFTKMVDSL